MTHWRPYVDAAHEAAVLDAQPVTAGSRAQWLRRVADTERALAEYGLRAVSAALTEVRR